MKEYEAILIKDEPKLYEYSSIHKQIASSIIKAYNSCNSVALYGFWGAGKSSIVKMIASNLGIKEVTFDFWKTSDDKLKKAFLETILKETENQSLKIKWGGKDVVALDLITGRYQEIKVKNTFEELTLWQKITTIIFLSILSFFTLTSLQTKINTYIENDIPTNLCYLLSFFIIPAIIWTIVFSCSWAKDIAQLVSRKVAMLSTNEIKQNNSTTSDLSELAFLEIYSKIIEAIEYTNKTYLVCLDNLDRIEKDKARDVLDEIYLFINAINSKYIRFIVPLNSEALSCVLKGGIKNSNENFIHKLLPTHFELPNLINFDWRSILKSKIEEAFKSIDEQLTNEIVFIFEATMSKHIEYDDNGDFKDVRRTNYNLTPRDIIYFVNSMVSTYWLIFPLEIELADIALYVGIKQNNRKPVIDDYFKNLKDKHHTVFNYFNNDERVKNLYKIHYQADTPYETMLRNPITNALNNKDINAIKELLIGVPSSEVESFLVSIISSSKNEHSYEDIYFYYDIANKLNSDIFNIKIMITTIKSIFFTVISKSYYRLCGNEKANPGNSEIETLIDFLKDYATNDKEVNCLNYFWFNELENACDTIKKKLTTDPFTINELNTIRYLYKIINKKMIDKEDVYPVSNEIITTIIGIKPKPNVNGQVVYSIDYIQFGLAIIVESLYFLTQNKQPLLANVNIYLNNHIQNNNDTILNTGVYYFLAYKNNDAFIKILLSLTGTFTLMSDGIKSNCLSYINKESEIIIKSLNNYKEHEIISFFGCLHDLYKDIELALKKKLTSMSIADTKNISLALVKNDINNSEYLPVNWYSNSELRNILVDKLEANNFIKIIKAAWQIGSDPTSDKEWICYWQHVDPLIDSKNWDDSTLAISTSNTNKIPSDIGSKLLQAIKDSMHDSALFLQIYNLAKDYFQQEKKLLQTYFKKQFESPIDATHAEIIKSAKIAELTITNSMCKKFNKNVKDSEASEHSIKAKEAMKVNFPEFNDK